MLEKLWTMCLWRYYDVLKWYPNTYEIVKRWSQKRWMDEVSKICEVTLMSVAQNKEQWKRVEVFVCKWWLYTKFEKFPLVLSK